MPLFDAKDLTFPWRFPLSLPDRMTITPGRHKFQVKIHGNPGTYTSHWQWTVGSSLEIGSIGGTLSRILPAESVVPNELSPFSKPATNRGGNCCWFRERFASFSIGDVTGVIHELLELGHRDDVAGNNKRVVNRTRSSWREWCGQIGQGLFRCHILRRPGHNAALRQTRIIDRASQPEVCDANAGDTVFQKNIGGLDVSMHNALCMSRRESLCNLQGYSHGFANVHRTVAVDSRFQGFTVYILHDQKRRRFFDGMNRDNMLMGNRCRRSTFANEALSSLAVTCQMRCQQLNRHDASQRTIKRLEHNSHPAASGDAQDIIVPEPTNRARFNRRFNK